MVEIVEFLPQRENFLDELRRILHHDYDDIYYKTTFKELYMELESTFLALRDKYGVSENPVYTNTIIVMFLADLKAHAYHMLHEDELGLSYEESLCMEYKDGVCVKKRKGFKRDILNY